MTTQIPHLFQFGLEPLAYEPDNQLLGVKGANLARMAKSGLPVPPGIIVGTEIGKAIAENETDVPGDILKGIHTAIEQMENQTGRGFGANSSPLLLSVRSGAAVSMPGMMDSVLNLGLNSTTVDALAKDSGGERFAWDSYRRFIQSFSHVVLDIDYEIFEDVLEDARADNGVESDGELSVAALKQVVETFLGIVVETHGEAFPQDVQLQLEWALRAVFLSWKSRRATRYRDMHQISHDGGTAAIVQAMVFGNRDELSCSGVYFTRNPSTGEAKPYGEYMPLAQGEDVVSGIRTPMELTEAGRVRSMSDHPSMEKRFPTAYGRLIECGELLERQFKNMQEVEFTVESGNLHILQTRNGKRAPRAGLKIAVDLVTEGHLTKAEGLAIANLESAQSLLVPSVDKENSQRPLVKGLPASPGAISGEIVFSSDSAVQRQKDGKSCILVRPETDPKDVHGMHASAGILTSRGGMTSHAAVVARGMGKPCITAANGLKIDVRLQRFECMDQVFKAGEVITIDGGTGLVYPGEQPLVSPEPEGDLATLLNWRDEN